MALPATRRIFSSVAHGDRAEPVADRRPGIEGMDAAGRGRVRLPATAERGHDPLPQPADRGAREHGRRLGRARQGAQARAACHEILWRTASGGPYKVLAQHGTRLA